MIVLPQPSSQPVRCLAFSPDGLTLACAGGKERGIALWDLAARENRPVLGGQGCTITSIAFSSDGELLASANSAGSLWVWSVKEPRSLARQMRWERGPAHSPGHVVFSPDSKWLATTLDDVGEVIRSARRRHAVNLLPVAKRPVDRSPVASFWTGHHAELTHLAYSPDGTRLAAGSFDRSVSIWDVSSRDRVALLFHGQKVHYLAFSSDGRTLAAGNPQGLVKLWDAATGRKLLTLKGQAKPLRALCYSPDGKVIVTAGGEGVVTFWDVQTGKSRTAFDWGIGEVFSVAFAADGMRAAAGGAGQVVIWDVDGWEV
jgi:eukaryotic-like serine/threonine-protein kinase